MMKYTSLAPMTPFLIPAHPGILTVAHGATQYKIALAKTSHNEAIHNSQAYQLGHRASIQQVLEVIEDRHRRTLNNRITVHVPTDIWVLYYICLGYTEA